MSNKRRGSVRIRMDKDTIRRVIARHSALVFGLLVGMAATSLALLQPMPAIAQAKAMAT